MLELLKTLQKGNRGYLIKLGYKEKTIKAKMKAVDDFIMFVGISLAVHNPELLNSFERKQNKPIN